MPGGRKESGIGLDRGAAHRGGATLADIARAAGVSTATVSRVLNAPDRVRPERLERVRAAIRALGYVPHGAARTLASNRSMTVGAVIPTLDNAIFAQGLAAFQARLQEAGYTLLLASSDYDLDGEGDLVDTLIARRVDGLMLVGRDHRGHVFERLARHRLPYVLSWAHDETGRLPCVGFDNKAAAAAAASALIEAGHRRVAMIAGRTADNDRARDRLAGARAALDAAGIGLPGDLVIEAPYGLAAGRAAMEALLDRAEPPTGVLCGNDVLAVGALLACRDRGVAVPGAVSVVGFDDLPWAKEFRPALTTMRVPADAMGRAAAEALIDALDGAGPVHRTALDATLIRRETVGPPPARAAAE